jgi:hypothetical protein
MPGSGQSRSIENVLLIRIKCPKKAAANYKCHHCNGGSKVNEFYELTINTSFSKVFESGKSRSICRNINLLETSVVSLEVRLDSKKTIELRVDLPKR